MTPRRESAAITFVLLLISAVVITACGSSSKSQTITAAQAQAISQEFVSALSSALTSSFSGFPPSENEHPSVAGAISRVRPADASGCTITNNVETCNIPITYSGSCPGGGAIAVTGAFDFTLDNSGDGSDSSTLTILPTNCSVSNLVINGDPNVTVSTQLNIKADAISFPITLNENGGISYGPNPSGHCTLNATMTVNSPTSCSISANICGQKFSGSC